jgi:uncharacterized membrane protein
MRKTIAKAVTWRLIGTAEIFAISFWTTGHMVTAGHTAGIAAVSSFVMYVAHELAWNEVRGGIKLHQVKEMFVQMRDHAWSATLKGWTGVRIISTPDKSVGVSAEEVGGVAVASTDGDSRRTRRCPLANLGFLP